MLDRDILDPLPRDDRRVEFIRESLVDLDAQLQALGRAHGHRGVRLIVRHGHAPGEIVTLAQRLGVDAVFANHDDEPAALARDAAVRDALANVYRRAAGGARRAAGRAPHPGIALHTHKDHVIFERSEVMTKAGTP